MSITVICREITSPAPPVAPWPLVYSFTVQNLNSVEEETLKEMIAQVRLDELELDDDDFAPMVEGIAVDMVFVGDLHPILDFRQ